MSDRREEAHGSERFRPPVTLDVPADVEFEEAMLTGTVVGHAVAVLLVSVLTMFVIERWRERISPL